MSAEAGVGGSRSEELPAAAWAAVLDALEASLDALGASSGVLSAEESALARREEDPDHWPPPRPDAPLPASLVPRARRINERQLVMTAQLGAELDALRRHRSAVGSVRAATLPQPSAVYVDTTG